MSISGNVSILILGSCVTRDGFSYASNDDLKLAGYMARTSLASQSRRSWFDESILVNIDSPFQKKMVEFDMKKNMTKKIQNTDFDLLIVDLIDDRFDLVEQSEDCYATRSVEFLKGLNGKPVGRIIPHGSEEYEVLWRQGFEKLLSCLVNCGKKEKIRVNEVYWATKTDHGKSIQGFAADRIKEENDLLSQRYGYMRRILGKDQFYSFEDKYFVADENHKWGVSPFHYTSFYYKSLMDKIKGDCNYNLLC
ncbi:DUF6270 domain-containing protein [Billgrantia sp. C5P2]|uniref:DUF6270 domain-containing protein n=1 Tax=Billgrantia sp. C5P2 TaxID=3436239 RepID=UPI003DA24685